MLFRSLCSKYHVTGYPYLAIFTASEQMVDFQVGYRTLDVTLPWLYECLENAAVALTRRGDNNNNIGSSRSSSAVPPAGGWSEEVMLRQEQDRDYERSLAEDRRKEEEARAAERRREEAAREMERAAQQAAVEAQQRQAELAAIVATLPSEPEPSAPGATTIVFRTPSGSRISRRFHETATVGQLYRYLHSQSLPQEEHVLMTNLPTTYYTDENMTLQEAGLTPKALLIIQEK